MTKHKPSRLLVSGLIFVFALTMAVPGTRPAKAVDGHMVQVTYENLTTGQTFSPGGFVSHGVNKPTLFMDGAASSKPLQRMAEEGDPSYIASKAAANLDRSIGDYYTSDDADPLGTVTLELMVDSQHPLVSGVWMLGRTNDGFAGITNFNAWDLEDGESITIDVMGWDAGSEVNNEESEFMPALGGVEMRDLEHGVVHMHTGIDGDADAPDEWDWDTSEPVARITITDMSDM